MTKTQPQQANHLAVRPAALRSAALAAAGALAIWLVAGAADAQADYTIRVSPEQTALAQATCTNVMRIRKGMVPFDACVESLSQTLASKNENKVLTKSYDDCFGAGHKEGTAGFALCVLDRKARNDAEWDRAASSEVAKPIPDNFKESGPAQISYSASNPEERRRKMEYSCAQLGIPPGSPGFSLCVAELDNALRSVEYFD